MININKSVAAALQAALNLVTRFEMKGSGGIDCQIFTCNQWRKEDLYYLNKSSLSQQPLLRNNSWKEVTI